MEVNTWVVRAGRGGRYIEDFIEQNIVALGWHEMGSLKGLSRDALIKKVSEVYPEYKKRQAIQAGSQLYRFLSEFSIGDFVVSYDSSQRVYYYG